ncbi:MAG: hypothetical protein Kapaf2KO_23020 [Candidatus Kapaibacteriales bacterium]
MHYPSRYLGLILLFLAFAFLISCSDSNEDLVAKIKLEEESPDQVSIDFKMDFIDSNRVKTRLLAGRGRVYNKKLETLLDSGVTVDFYSAANGERISRLTADSARIDDRTKDMHAYGRVVVVSDSSQTTLKTSYLNWKNKEEKIFSDQYVEIDSPQEYVTGVGFESDKKLENYIIYDVSGEQKQNAE